MEESLKSYLYQISKATLEISQTPQEYLEILTKNINVILNGNTE